MADDDEDPRAYSHGIAAIPDGKDGYRIFFSSSGLIPQGPDKNDNWTHDIYTGEWKPGQARLQPRLFIGKPEAQEPVDAARSENGHILVTLEDGWDTYGEVEQRYGVYDQNLKPIKPYPNTVSDGGHSGHAAAVGKRFIIFYSDEWIKGGGVDDLGSGDGVYVRIYNSNGKPLFYVPVAPNKREWWPLIAASPENALLVWQAFVKGETYATLKFSMLDPRTGKITEPQILHEGIQYYTYAVHYLAKADRYLVTGTAKEGRGFAVLIDRAGKRLAEIPCMPPTVREAGIADLEDDAFMPSADNRLLRLHVTASTLALTGALNSPLIWSTVGSIGLPDGPQKLHWFSLAKTGLQESDFDVTKSAVPTPSDLCR